MHFVVSWEINSKDNYIEEINSSLMEGLLGYSWLRLLRTFYILEVEHEHDWHVIHEKLLTIAQRYPGKVNFLMSPLYDLDSDYFVYKMPDSNFYQAQ